MPAVEDLLTFISASPSPYHAVAEAERRLSDAGFSEVQLTDPWPLGGGLHWVQRGGALVAWADTDLSDLPFRVVGAHTDSPNLRVKPRPDTGSVGWRQLSVEVYGGPLLNSWLDRDLGLSGRVAVRTDEGITERIFRVDRPLLRIPQLAIHLDRELSSQGLKLNPQEHLTPVWGVGPTTDGDFVEFLAEQVSVGVTAVLGWDVMVHDLTPPARLGLHEELVAAPRIDNQLSCWAAIDALVDSAAASTAPAVVPVVCLFDHEEVGSASTTGADGRLLADVLERVDLVAGGGRERLFQRLAQSHAASADGAHATHPNYRERHDPEHVVAIDGGPVIKVNANQRYATDAVTAAVLADACDRAGVPHQRFVSRNDQPCGSTIGPLTAARLGIATADIGVAQLSMHSARELCGATDPSRLAAALRVFLAG